MKPHVYPIDNPETAALWNQICQSVSRQDLAADILRMIQQSLDKQAAIIEHAEIIQRLIKIVASIVKQCSESDIDMAAYCKAFSDALAFALAVRSKIAWPTAKRPDSAAWLQAYSEKDLEVAAELIFEAAGETADTTTEAQRTMCKSFIKDVTKNILDVAQGDIKLAKKWDAAIDQLLEDLLSEDGDFFGTEGQCDPRGDRRG